MTDASASADRLVAQNRKASHDYTILDTLEAGLVLKGTEVKSLRNGKASLQESWAVVENGEVFVHQLHIPPYEQGNRWNLDPVRTRKLLLHRSEIEKLRKAIEQKGHTLIPLKLYFTKGRAKLLLGVAKGRKTHDKREAIAERDARREMDRARAVETRRMSGARSTSPGRVARAVAMALGLAAAATAAGAPDTIRVPSGLGIPFAPVTDVQGTPMVGANDLARLLGAARQWRADVRKLVLRSGEHRLTFSADNPFVLVDDRTVRLSANVVSVAGELQIPVEIVGLLPAEAGWPRLAHDPSARQLRVAPGGGFIGSPSVETRGGVTRLVIPTGHPDAAVVLGKSRARFRVRMAGGLVGALPDSLPEDGLVRDLDASPSAGGVTFELALDPAAAAWQIERDAASGSVRLSFSRQPEPGSEPFATEGASGPRQLRTVVLDPGHGGSDPGVEIEGASEKALTVELALRVAGELERRGHIRVALTRREDLAIPQELRAETANHERADAVISLHFGAFPNREAHGTIAWCPPATQPTDASNAAAAAGLVALIPWRDVALDRAVESRGLAESVTSSLERAGFGPSSVRERLPVALVGVQSPGILLECGALTNPGERDRILSPAGLRALAIAIADGVLAWQRNE